MMARASAVVIASTATRAAAAATSTVLNGTAPMLPPSLSRCSPVSRRYVSPSNPATCQCCHAADTPGPRRLTGGLAAAATWTIGCEEDGCAYPDDAYRAAHLGERLGVPVVYGFWHLPPADDSDARIRFATASQVATFAEATIEANPGVVVRLHVWIDMFNIDIHRIDDLLDRPSRPAQLPDDGSGEEAG